MISAESSYPSTDDKNLVNVLNANIIITPKKVFIKEQSLPNSDQQQSSETTATAAAATTVSTINAFTNFRSSCCCRQMIMIRPAAKTTEAIKNSNNCKKLKNDITSANNDIDSNTSASSSCNKSSPFTRFLPVAMCLISFATVLSLLIIYMDTTEIRHKQFKINMTRDYEFYGIPQDDPQLVQFLREYQMKKYPLNFKNAPVEHFNFTEHHELAPEMAHYISTLVDGKSDGVFIQSMTGSSSNVITAPWLAETLNWSGLIIEPEPRRFFQLRKQNFHRPKTQIVHACVSPTEYPKEVRIHNENDAEVRINSLVDEEASWFNPRIKCFPLYTLMLAINKVNYDLLSLGCQNQELQILKTLPFKKVNIEVISIHLTENTRNSNEYIRNITKFLSSKSYQLQRRFDNNYIFQKINTTNRTRKKLYVKPTTQAAIIKPAMTTTSATVLNTTTSISPSTTIATASPNVIMMTSTTAKTNKTLPGVEAIIVD